MEILLKQTYQNDDPDDPFSSFTLYINGKSELTFYTSKVSISQILCQCLTIFLSKYDL